MSIDEFSEGDIIHRINSQCLVGGISDKDFRNNAQSLLEDILGYFMGRYEVMAEFRPPQMDGCIACHEDLTDRIAELNAKVASLRVAVTQGYAEGFNAGVNYQAADDDTGLDYWTAWNKSIARNALRELG